MLSTNVMPNSTLVNSLSFSRFQNGSLVERDLAFTSTTATEVYWMVNFGYVCKIHAVFIMGTAYTVGGGVNADGKGWYATFGNSANACTNQILYT